MQLTNENAQAERMGVQEIGRLSTDRHIFENEQKEAILMQLNSEKNLSHELGLEL